MPRYEAAVCILRWKTGKKRLGGHKELLEVLCWCVFASQLRGWERTSVSDRTGGSIVSQAISSAVGEGFFFLCAEDGERKMEVSWVEERKEKLPVWISGLNIWWIEEYQIIPGAFKSHKVASSKSHNSSDGDSSFYLGPLRAGEADRDKGRGVFFFPSVGAFTKVHFSLKISTSVPNLGASVITPLWTI